MRRAGLLCALVLLAAGPRAQEPQPTRETAVAAALDAFWQALGTGDAEGFRAAVDLPLTLQEIGAEGAVGERFVVTAADWPRWARLFPDRPRADLGPAPRVADLRLEWITPRICQAVYNVSQDEGDRGRVALRQTTLLVRRDGWRVALSTLPT